MSFNLKQKNKANDEDDLKNYDETEEESIEEDEDESDEAESFEKEININFEACEILKADLEGIIRLLKQLFLTEPINLFQLSQLLCSQKNIGSILRQFINEEEIHNEEDDEENEEDDTLGIVSFIDLNKNKNEECIKSIQNYLIKYLKGEKRQKMEELLSNEKRKVLILNERFINLSWQLAIPSFEQLCKEMDQNQLQFDYYIFICKILYPKQKGHNFKKQKQVKEDVIFLNPEDEIFSSMSDEKFEFSVAHQCDSDPRGGDWDEDAQQFVPYRRVLFLKSQSWVNAINELKQMK